ncbi:MAG TPA: hypothetical protein VEA36_00120 [Candidatus Paceibacterota bacterium]|nr:hypothetical protein [Candidatus Paceibacterota bacterium]
MAYMTRVAIPAREEKRMELLALNPHGDLEIARRQAQDLCAALQEVFDEFPIGVAMHLVCDELRNAGESEVSLILIDVTGPGMEDYGLLTIDMPCGSRLEEFRSWGIRVQYQRPPVRLEAHFVGHDGGPTIREFIRCKIAIQDILREDLERQRVKRSS